MAAIIIILPVSVSAQTNRDAGAPVFKIGPSISDDMGATTMDSPPPMSLAEAQQWVRSHWDADIPVKDFTIEVEVAGNACDKVMRAKYGLPSMGGEGVLYGPENECLIHTFANRLYLAADRIDQERIKATEESARPQEPPYGAVISLCIFLAVFMSWNHLLALYKRYKPKGFEL